MFIRCELPKEYYMKFDRNIFLDHRLSDGAVRLYGYLAGHRNSDEVTDEYIRQKMNLSKAVLARRKKELKDVDLLIVEQIHPRVYMAYVGNSVRGATAVKKYWDNRKEELEK